MHNSKIIDWLSLVRSSTWGHGVADVVYQDGASVWGVLYAVDDMCLSALDIKESLGIGYDRKNVLVTTQAGDTYNAITYMVINKLEKEILPSRAYAQTFIEGAEEHNLPTEYLVFLKSIAVAD